MKNTLIFLQIIRYDLDCLSVLEHTLKETMYRKFEQMVLQSREKILQGESNKLIDIIIHYVAFDSAKIIVNEIISSLATEVNDDTICGMIMLAIISKHTEAFNLLFPQLCSKLNIHTLEDIQEVHCDAEDDCDDPCIHPLKFPDTCCIQNNERPLMTDRDDRLVEQNVIETLLICAVLVGNMEVLKYIVRKTNTIVRNELIRNIMRLLPEDEDVCHKKSMSAFKYLLDQSSDLNSIDDEGRNLLHWTVENGCFFMLPVSKMTFLSFVIEYLRSTLQLVGYSITRIN